MRTVKQTRKHTAKTCPHCKQLFMGISIKRYCSPNCRAANYTSKHLKAIQ